MTALGASIRPPLTERLWGWIQKEMAPFPGRSEAVARFLLCSALVVITSMTLQVPFLALSLIMVFFTAQENTVLTRLSGIVLIIGSTLALALSALLLKISINEPMVRLIGASLIAFCGMYFMRISKLGVIGFLVALTVFYSQSFADLYDNPEVIIRALLWVWVAVTYPIVVTIAVNLLLFPPHPLRLLNEEMLRQLQEARQQIEARLRQEDIPALPLESIENGIQQLHRHLAFAARAASGIAKEQARYLLRITAIDRLHTAAAHLSQLPAMPLSPTQDTQARFLLRALLAIEQALSEKAAVTLTEEQSPGQEQSSPVDLTFREMKHAVETFASADAMAASPGPVNKDGGLVPDAFSNPSYVKFAIKSVLSAMLCYLFYVGVQWPGIHTAMLTSFILALPSLGASSHKGLTRIAGCAIGSLISLLATVFVIPHLESLTGLLLLTLPVIAIGAWIAAGSARSNYIGVQLVFAYALALLGQFGPSTDLTEIRDRMIGILIGVLIFLLVSGGLWPEREGDDLRRSLSKLMHSIADLARAGNTAMDKARVQGWMLLSHNRALLGRAALEPGWQYAHDSVTPSLTIGLAQIQETLFAVNWLKTLSRPANPLTSPDLQTAREGFEQAAAQELDRLASALTSTAADTRPATKLTLALQQLEQACHTDSQGSPDQALAEAARRVCEKISHLHSHLLASQAGRMTTR